MQISAPPTFNDNSALSNWLNELYGLLLSQPISDLIPLSSSDVGVPGQMAYDNNYLYVCYDIDSWARIAYTDVVF
jgi:hypothetical protein